MSDVSLALGSTANSRSGSPTNTHANGTTSATKEWQAAAAAEQAAVREGNVVAAWVRYRLCSRDRVERHFAFLIALLICASLLFAALKPVGPMAKW